MAAVDRQPAGYRRLHLALEIVGYELALRGDDYAVSDPIAALDALRDQAAAHPSEATTLAEVYPEVVQLAARALLALGSLPEPDEVDGLVGFEGFELWRQSR
jgi:hypothetical protein